MKKSAYILLFIVGIGLTSWALFYENIYDQNILAYTVNPVEQKLKFFLKDSMGNNYSNFLNLRTSLKKENKNLVFAMNGGMYMKDFSPQGLFIENGIELTKLDTIEKGYGNFYLQPNGVFYLTDENIPRICKTTDFNHNSNIKYATQSGPMLIIDGQLHPKLTKGSENLNIRNGVGVLPDGNLLFAISKEEINFYDFATFFKQNGCENALYLDGFVSKAYLPKKNWIQLDGTFGVIIGEIKQ